jgi:hypothetical protein
MSGNSILLNAIETHQASTCIGIDALSSRLLLVASEQVGDSTAGQFALSRISKIQAVANGRGRKSCCVMRMDLKANRTPWGQRVLG